MFETEAHIRTRIVESLKSKRRTDKGEVDIARVERELNTPEYTKWIEERVEDARRAKRLVTEKQHADLRARREFRVGDKARYIGPTVLRTSPVTGRNVTCPSGQTGSITRVERGTHGRLIFTWLPDIPATTRAAADNGLDVEVLEVRTHAWIEYERIG